jgi:cysteine desulfurase
MENVPGVVAMAVALREAAEAIPERAARGWRLTERLRAGIESEVPGARVHGHPTQRVPHLVCFSIHGVDTETLVMAMDDRGFRIGAGSVCSGAPGDPSPVLEAIGLPDTPGVRVSIGPDSADADVDRFLVELTALVAELARVEQASSRAMERPGPAQG